MIIRNELKYTRSHEWVKLIDEKTALVGLTDFAQDSLGGIVFVNLPAKGDTIASGESLGDVESVKAVSDIFSPVSGTVTKVNEMLLDSPEAINDEPYETWLVEVSNITDYEELLSPEDYEKFCEEV